MQTTHAPMKQPNLPSVNTPHGLYYSQGLKEKQVEFSTVCHSRFLFCQMTRIPHAGWQQAVWLLSFSLWHKMPVFGKWLPLEPPHGKSSSQSQQRSELIHLKQNKISFFLCICKATEANCDMLKQTAMCTVIRHQALLAMLHTLNKHLLMLVGVRSPWGKPKRKMHTNNRSRCPLTIRRHSKLTKLLVWNSEID